MELHALVGNLVLEFRSPGRISKKTKQDMSKLFSEVCSKLVHGKQNLFSPVFGHGSCGGIQSVLSVELKAAIYEGSANADLRLQLGQLVLHSLVFISARAGK